MGTTKKKPTAAPEPKLLVAKDRREWLAHRLGGLGGSDVAAILGVNPYKGALAVYAEKRRLVEAEAPEEDDDDEVRAMGHVMEPVVALLYAERTGAQVQAQPLTVLVHPEFTWARGSIDRRIVQHPQRGAAPGVLECKNTGERFRPEWEAGGPDLYLVQLQWYLAVTGDRWGVLAAVVGGNHFVAHEMDRNDALIQVMLEQAAEFWQRVQRGDPPPADATPGTSRVLRQMHPKDSGRTVVLPGQAEEWVRRWRAARDARAQASQEEEHAGNLLRAAMGDATWGAVPGEDTRMQWRVEPRKAELCKGCGAEVRAATEPRVLRNVKGR